MPCFKRPLKEDVTHEQSALLASIGGLVTDIRRSHFDMGPSFENRFQVCRAGFYDAFDTLSIRRSAGRLAILRALGKYCLRYVAAWKIRADFTLQSAAQAVVDRSSLIAYILSSAVDRPTDDRPHNRL